ncbi:hypothetical protein LguiA_026528 [Lonicera macranthoides]
MGSAKGEEEGLVPDAPATGDAADDWGAADGDLTGAAETNPTNATKTRARKNIWRAILVNLTDFFFFFTFY